MGGRSPGVAPSGRELDHLIITRFNLRIREYGPAVDDDGLRHRLGLFRSFTLTSVRAQTSRSFRWFVLCDEDSPPWLLSELEAEPVVEVLRMGEWAVRSACRDDRPPLAPRRSSGDHPPRQRRCARNRPRRTGPTARPSTRRWLHPLPQRPLLQRGAAALRQGRPQRVRHPCREHISPNRVRVPTHRGRTTRPRRAAPGSDVDPSGARLQGLQPCAWNALQPRPVP